MAHSEPQPKPDRHLPDPASCRANRVASTDSLYHCLVDHPDECVHALVFDDAVFCQYPENAKIAAATPPPPAPPGRFA